MMASRRASKRAPASRPPAQPAAPPAAETATGVPAGTTIIIQQQQSQGGGVPDQRILIIALMLGAVPFVIGALAWMAGPDELAIVLLVVGGGCAITGILLSFYAMWGYWGVPGYQSAKVLAVVSLTFGMLSFGLFVVVPLIALLFCRPPAANHSCNASCPSCVCTCDSGQGCGDPCAGCCGSGEASGGSCCDCGGSGQGTPPSQRPGDSGSTPHVGVVATGGALATGGLAARLGLDGLRAGLRSGHFAHHPEGPEFRHDVFVVRGMRLCVGCLVVFPAFLVLLPFESILLGLVDWQAAFLSGLGSASMQAISALGWTRRRWLKVLVKSCLGAGLALFLIGVRAAPWPIWLQALVVCAVLVIALASTLPRRARIARIAAAD